MVSSTFLLAPSVLSNEVAFSIAFCDLLLKSLLLVVVASYIGKKCIRWLGNAGVYALWLTTLICMMLLPLLSGQIVGPTILFETTNEQLSLVTIPLYQNLLQLETLDPLDPVAVNVWLQAVVFVYFTVLIFLCLSLLVSIRQVLMLIAASIDDEDSLPARLLQGLTREFGIRQQVRLCISEDVEAPFSFNIRKPVVVVPATVLDWEAAKIESVLVHELGHIRRNDGRVLLSCQLLTYLCWFNPFAWIVMKKIRAAAEFNCDDAVLSRGASHIRYAQDLVNVARTIMDSRKRRCFVQYMIDAREIKARVENIMQRRPVKKAFSGPVLAHCVVMTLIALAIGLNTNIVNARYQDFVEAGRLIHSEQPRYPLAAYEAGIQGWVLVNFDVDRQGRVDQDSIDIQFSQPVGVFEEVALESLNSFQFKAKRINGEPVATSDHRYMFRFRLPRTL